MNFNKYNIKYSVFTLLLMLMCNIANAIQSDLFQNINLRENLLLNSDFEEGTDKWIIPAAYAQVSTQNVYQGTKSIYFKNTNNQVNPTRVTQSLIVGPGETIYFGIKVKGQALDASAAAKDNYGARVYIQSYDVDGNFINGIYPASSGSGTFDWKEIGGIYTVPINAVSVSIGFGLMPNVVGEAWFDSAFIAKEENPLFQSFLVTPNYRGMMVKGDQSPIITNCRMTPTPNEIGKTGEVKFSLLNNQRSTLHSENKQFNIETKEVSLPFDISSLGLNTGDYIFKIEYKSDNQSLSYSDEYAIEVVTSMPKVYIDKEGFTVKDGVRIFPLGLYIGEPDQEHLERIKNAGFNTVLSYGYGNNTKAETFLDRAYSNNLNVVYSLKDMYEGTSLNIPNPRQTAVQFINKLKNKPALLSWYTVDELLPEWLPKIKNMYDDIKDNDKDHPAFQVHYYESANMFEKYYNTTDIFAADPYPIGRANLTLSTVRNNASVQASHQSKGVWSVPQIMDWAIYEKDRAQRPPTLAEMRNQSYQALIAGAKGLVYYTYYDLFYTKWPRGTETYSIDSFNARWADVSKMSKEIDSLVPAILYGVDKQVTLSSSSDVTIKCIEYNNELLLLVANPYYATKSIDIVLPTGWNLSKSRQGDIEGNVNNGVLRLQLPDVASGVYRLSSGEEPEQQGIWKNKVDKNWVYNLEGAKNTDINYYGGRSDLLNSGTSTAYSKSITSQTSLGFMPRAQSGNVLVQAGGQIQTGTFSIETENDKKKLIFPIAQSGIPVNKLSFYGIDEATSVLATKYRLTLNKTPDAGTIAGGIFFIIGNHTTGTTVFTNNGGISGTATPTVFGAFQWLFKADGQIHLRVRQNGGSDYKVISTTDFQNGGDYVIEVYANNSDLAQEYIRNEMKYNISAGKIHFWVANKRLTLDGSPELPNSGDNMPVNTTLNSFTLIPAKQNNTQYDNEKISLGELHLIYADNVASMPVQFLDFYAKQETDNGVILKWSTVNEINNKSFYIYRSSGISGFYKVAEIPVNNNTKKDVNTYSFRDSKPQEGINYYKLLQVDIDGSITEYPKVLSVYIDKKHTTSKLLSSVSKGKLSVIYSNTAGVGKGTIKLRNLEGKILLNQKVHISEGKNEFTFHLVNNIQGNLYVLELDREQETIVSKSVSQ